MFVFFSHDSACFRLKAKKSGERELFFAQTFSTHKLSLSLSHTHTLALSLALALTHTWTARAWYPKRHSYAYGQVCLAHPACQLEHCRSARVGESQVARVGRPEDGKVQGRCRGYMEKGIQPPMARGRYTKNIGGPGPVGCQ